MDGWSTLILLLLLALATWVDLRTNRVPNAIVLAGILLAFVLAGAAAGPRGLAAAMAGMFVAGGCLLPFYLGRGMGAGDVKLMAMVGALSAVALTLVAGLLLSGAALLARQAMASGFGLHLLSSGSARMTRPATEHGGARTLRFPYAMAILLGTLASLWFLADLKTAGELVGTLWTR